MSAISLTIQALLGESTVTDYTGTRIWPGVVPQGSDYPAIMVRLTGDDDPRNLTGSDQYPEATVAVHCIAKQSHPDTDSGVSAKVGFRTADALGEIVKGVLRDKGETINGVYASFKKAGTDFTDYDDANGTCRRVLTFDIRYR